MRIDPLPGKMNARTMVFSFDEKYAKYFSVLLASLFEHADRSVPYDLVVLYDELLQETMERILNMAPDGFSVRFFNVGSFALELLGNQSDRFSAGKWVFSTFYDLLIPFLMTDYERVVYIDTDIVFRSDAGELFEMPFDGSALIAVRDTFSAAHRMIPDNPFFAKQASFIRDYLGDENGDGYFNAGILVFNIPAIDLDEYRERMGVALAFPELPTVEQDVLNYIFLEKVKYAPLRLDLQVSIFDQFRDHPGDEEAELYRIAADEAAVIHYTTHEKPWLYPDCQMGGLFWSFAERSPFYEDILLENFQRLSSERKQRPAGVRLFLFLTETAHRIGLFPLRKLRRSLRRYLFLKDKILKYRKMVQSQQNGQDGNPKN